MKYKSSLKYRLTYHMLSIFILKMKMKIFILDESIFKFAGEPQLNQ